MDGTVENPGEKLTHWKKKREAEAGNSVKIRCLSFGLGIAQFIRGVFSMSLLGWALVFLVIALVAAIFGFGLVASAAAGIAKVLFFIFVVLFAIMLISGLLRRV